MLPRLKKCSACLPHSTGNGSIKSFIVRCAGNFPSRIASTIVGDRYQSAAIQGIYNYFQAESGNPLVVIPTAGGKSLVMATFVEGALRPGLT